MELNALVALSNEESPYLHQLEDGSEEKKKKKEGCS